MGRWVDVKSQRQSKANARLFKPAKLRFEKWAMPTALCVLCFVFLCCSGVWSNINNAFFMVMNGV